MCTIKFYQVIPYGNTSYVGIGQVQNGVMYIRYWTTSKAAITERCKTLIEKTFSYCIVKDTPRDPLALVTSRKSNVKISILLLSFFFFVFPHI